MSQVYSSELSRKLLQIGVSLVICFLRQSHFEMYTITEKSPSCFSFEIFTHNRTSICHLFFSFYVYFLHSCVTCCDGCYLSHHSHHNVTLLLSPYITTICYLGATRCYRGDGNECYVRQWPERFSQIRVRIYSFIYSIT